MTDVLAVALASMQADLEQVDRVAHNLANVATAGYKREVSAGRPFAAALDEAATAAQAAPAGGAFLPVRARVDASAGSLRLTGHALDLAIEGAGFFEVATEAGPAFTRAGDFRLDASGRLVTGQGHPVMGTDGEIRLVTSTPVIDASGRITEPDAAPGDTFLAQGRPVSQLKIVQFQHGTGMRHLGNGLLAADAAPSAAGNAETRVRQGALENSNVSTMEEMVRLIQTTRHFESMQKIVQGYDELLSTSIRKLGDLS
jgi:flagellar basal-body rod protein FlgG